MNRPPPPAPSQARRAPPPPAKIKKPTPIRPTIPASEVFEDDTPVTNMNVNVNEQPEQQIEPINSPKADRNEVKEETLISSEPQAVTEESQDRKQNENQSLMMEQQQALHSQDKMEATEITPVNLSARKPPMVPSAKGIPKKNKPPGPGGIKRPPPIVPRPRIQQSTQQNQQKSQQMLVDATNYPNRDVQTNPPQIEEKVIEQPKKQEIKGQQNIGIVQDDIKSKKDGNYKIQEIQQNQLKQNQQQLSQKAISKPIPAKVGNMRVPPPRNLPRAPPKVPHKLPTPIKTEQKMSLEQIQAQKGEQIMVPSQKQQTKIPSSPKEIREIGKNPSPNVSNPITQPRIPKTDIPAPSLISSNIPKGFQSPTHKIPNTSQKLQQLADPTMDIKSQTEFGLTPRYSELANKLKIFTQTQEQLLQSSSQSDEDQVKEQPDIESPRQHKQREEQLNLHSPVRLDLSGSSQLLEMNTIEDNRNTQEPENHQKQTQQIFQQQQQFVQPQRVEGCVKVQANQQCTFQIKNNSSQKEERQQQFTKQQSKVNKQSQIPANKQDVVRERRQSQDNENIMETQSQMNMNNTRGTQFFYKDRIDFEPISSPTYSPLLRKQNKTSTSNILSLFSKPSFSNSQNVGNLLSTFSERKQKYMENADKLAELCEKHQQEQYQKVQVINELLLKLDTYNSQLKKCLAS